MPVDVNALADQVFSAMKAGATQLGNDELAALKTEATRLAQSLATIEVQRLTKNITDQQAQNLVAAQASASRAVLEAELGIGELNVKGIIVAGLQVLASVALSAAGLGWAAPLLQAVVANL